MHDMHPHPQSILRSDIADVRAERASGAAARCPSLNDIMLRNPHWDDDDDDVNFLNPSSVQYRDFMTAPCTPIGRVQQGSARVEP